MKAIEVGEIYSCTIPGIRGDFDVVVLERLKYSGFLVEAIDYNDEQEKVLKKKKYKFITKVSALKEKTETEKVKIEIGKIYFCDLPQLDKPIEVEILEKVEGTNYLVRVIRCTLEQRKILLKAYRSRFTVTEKQILGESVNFEFNFQQSDTMS